MYQNKVCKLRLCTSYDESLLSSNENQKCEKCWFEKVNNNNKQVPKDKCLRGRTVGERKNSKLRLCDKQEMV